MVSPSTRSAQGVHHARLEERRRARVPQAMLHTGPGLQQPDRQEAEQHHQGQANIDGPEGKGQYWRLPDAVGSQPFETEEHEPDAEHAVHAKQRRMPMHGVV